MLSGMAALEATAALVDPALTVEVVRNDGEAFAAGDTLARLRGPLAAILAAERTGLELPLPPQRRGDAHGALRGRDGGHGCAHRRDAQDDTRPAGPREGGRRARRRYAAPLRPVRRRDDQGQPRRGGRRRRRPPSSACVRARPTRHGARGRGGHAGATRRGPGRAEPASCCSTTWTRRWCARRSSAPPAARSLEVSGGVRLERVRELAATGVDIISVGALTTRAPWIDISLDLEA